MSKSGSLGDSGAPRADMYLDARGLDCPLPVLKAKVALNRLEPGQILCVEATDPHASVDFAAYCARSGHELLAVNQQGSAVLALYIRRAAAPE